MKKLTQLLLVAVSMVGVCTASAQSKDPIANAILKIAQPYKQQLEAAYKKDKNLEGKLKVFEAEMRKITSDGRLKPEDKSAALARLSQKNIPLMREWFLKGQVSEANYQTEVDRFFKAHERRTRTRYAIQYTGFLSFTWRRIAPRFTPSHGDKEVTLAPPFPYIEEVENGLGSAIGGADTGKFYASAANLIAGGHENIAGIGHFYIVDLRYDSIEASAALPEVNYFAEANSYLLGASGSFTNTRIEILANNQIVCQEDVQNVGLVAPSLWFARTSGTENVVVGCEFEAPEVGDEIVVRFHGVAGSWVGGAAYSRAHIEGQPRDIRLRFKR
ncbi:MAG: hypothetical protein IT288_16620 [Bdellovibrionales bacterium]|nr:hypothetical protein [Bdellovibrionales bacterium]